MNSGKINLVDHWERVLKSIGNEEWCMILGDDDILENNFVEEFYKNLEEVENREISLIKFSQALINSEGEVVREATQLPQVYSSKQFLVDRMTKSFPNSLSENIFKSADFG